MVKKREDKSKLFMFSFSRRMYLEVRIGKIIDSCQRQYEFVSLPLTWLLAYIYLAM